MSDRIVIAGAKRTPMAGFQGEFSSLSASELGGAAIKAAVEDAGIGKRPHAKQVFMLGLIKVFHQQHSIKCVVLV